MLVSSSAFNFGYKTLNKIYNYENKICLYHYSRISGTNDF